MTIELRVFLWAVVLQPETETLRKLGIRLTVNDCIAYGAQHTCNRKRKCDHNIQSKAEEGRQEEIPGSKAVRKNELFGGRKSFRGELPFGNRSTLKPLFFPSNRLQPAKIQIPNDLGSNQLISWLQILTYF